MAIVSYVSLVPCFPARVTELCRPQRCLASDRHWLTEGRSRREVERSGPVLLNALQAGLVHTRDLCWGRLGCHLPVGLCTGQKGSPRTVRRWLRSSSLSPACGLGCPGPTSTGQWGHTLEGARGESFPSPGLSFPIGHLGKMFFPL